jgi:uncharacterized damage-inducible protein DinB
MTFIDLVLEELERESARTIRALENVPAHKGDWKPHDRSMAFGPLVRMVATMPSWVAMTITMDELDLAPKGGSNFKMEPMETSEALIAGHKQAMEQARAALKGTDEDFLETPWKLLQAGETVMEEPRHVVIRDSINHWAHHRGQLTVYLRLMGAKVPSLYGPSADDKRFL